jgi:hypothetical protein
MAIIPATFSTIINRPPSCIEILPSHPSYIFIGTYALEEIGDDGICESSEASETKIVSQKRSGSVVIMRLEEDVL